MKPFRGLEFFRWMNIWIQKSKRPAVTLERGPLFPHCQTRGKNRVLCISCWLNWILPPCCVGDVSAGLNLEVWRGSKSSISSTPSCRPDDGLTANFIHVTSLNVLIIFWKNKHKYYLEEKRICFTSAVESLDHVKLHLCAKQTEAVRRQQQHSNISWSHFITHARTLK